MFDLPGLTIDRLRKAGVTAENLDLCTYADDDRFFSYRRTTHAKRAGLRPADFRNIHRETF